MHEVLRLCQRLNDALKLHTVRRFDEHAVPRLQQARQLLWTQRLDAAEAAHRVGYASASQFTREYKRLFGHPPLRDARRQGAP